jgi:hypothetical protein
VSLLRDARGYVICSRRCWGRGKRAGQAENRCGAVIVILMCRRSPARRGLGAKRAPLLVVCGTTTRWRSRVVTTSRTTTWAIWRPPIAGGLWCRRRAALPATTTATAAGQSAQCGVPATPGIWRGAAGAGNSSMPLSLASSAGSATEAPSPCGKTSNMVDRGATPLLVAGMRSSPRDESRPSSR